MEQLLSQLGESLSVGEMGELGEGGGEELPREVVQVMQVLESQMSGQPVKPEVSAEERVERCREKQGLLESRYRRLQSRINKMRAEKLAAHATEQLQAVVGACDQRRARLHGESGVKKEEEEKELPAAQKVDEAEERAMRRLTKVKRVQKSKSDEVLGEVRAAVRHVQHLADPEATESSSGGDSADEQDVNPSNRDATLFAPLQERAAYQWFSNRAQLASQWVWLQAQVSDLEYKIRQHTELYRAQRASKGPVLLGEEVVLVKPSTNLSDSAALSLPSARLYARSPSLGEVGGDTSDEEATMTCSRVRPVKRVRRRKVVDTYGLHHKVAKAARLSSVACGCLHPDQWCVLCLGRRSHTAALDRSVQSRLEGAALLDHSYHAVLSDKVETPLSLALMESIASRRWLERRPSSANSQGASVPAHISKLINVNDLERKEKKKKDELANRRKYLKRKEREGKISKKRRKLDSERSSRPNSPTELGDLGSRELSLKVRDGVEKIRDRNSLAEQLKKKRKSNYDIDHIVIPYSMAATTRVERLQVKEIEIPKWKEVANQEVVKEVVKEECEEEVEPTSDLVYKLMHAKAEDEERTRWATPLGRVHGGQRVQSARGQRTRRLDSCRTDGGTEVSSGANTPSNPLSPETLERVEELVVSTRPGSPSQVVGTRPGSPAQEESLPTTPALLSPATPATPMTSMSTPVTAVPASLRGRRRTSSSTGRPRDRNLSEASQHSQESSRSTSPWTEVEDHPVVQPWEPRTFPLTDEEVKQLEDESSSMLPPSLCLLPAQSSATVSVSSRASSRASSVEERPGEDSADPDWDEEVEDRKERGDDDPEYDPETKQKARLLK